jgi:hypothetical protein
MYSWLLFVHIGSVLVFMLMHGVQVTVAWKIRWQPDPAQIAALFAPMPLTAWLRYAMLAVVVTGLALVLVLNLWTSAWIWASLALLGGIWLLMYRWGAAYLNGIEPATEAALSAGGTASEADARIAFDQARLSWLVPGMTIVGIGGVAAILWLMIFKPF